MTLLFKTRHCNGILLRGFDVSQQYHNLASLYLLLCLQVFIISVILFKSTLSYKIRRNYIIIITIYIYTLYLYIMLYVYYIIYIIYYIYLLYIIYTYLYTYIQILYILYYIIYIITIYTIYIENKQINKQINIDK